MRAIMILFLRLRPGAMPAQEGGIDDFRFRFSLLRVDRPALVEIQSIQEWIWL
jgi:hypothetical protein